MGVSWLFECFWDDVKDQRDDACCSISVESDDESPACASSSFYFPVLLVLRGASAAGQPRSQQQ